MFLQYVLHFFYFRYDVENLKNYNYYIKFRIWNELIGIEFLLENKSK